MLDDSQSHHVLMFSVCPDAFAFFFKEYTNSLVLKCFFLSPNSINFVKWMELCELQ